MKRSIATLMAVGVGVTAAAAGVVSNASANVKPATIVATVSNVASKQSISSSQPKEVSSSYWWGTQTWYSRSDVRNYASWYGVITVVNKVCYLFPGQFRNGCLRVVGAYTSWVYNTWMYAKNTGQCLTMRMLWTGQVIGINAYSCTWG